MKQIIELLPEDFKTSDFTSNKDCALARAFKRAYPHLRPNIGAFSFWFKREDHTCTRTYHLTSKDCKVIEPTDSQMTLAALVLRNYNLENPIPIKFEFTLDD